MACVALTSLMATIELEFLQPIPRVSLHDESAVMCCSLKRKPRVALHDRVEMLLEKISSLQTFLEEEYRGAAAIKDLETKIRDFALKAEDDIEIQLSNFLLARGTERKEQASKELHQSLREAAENAAELLKFIFITSNEADEADDTQPRIHLLKHASESENVKSDGSSWPELEVEMVGRRHDFRVIKDLLFDDNNDLKVISIVGMAGIGKTTLARSVYGDPSVASHFQVQLWITMPQEHNVSQTLCELIRSITLAEPNEIEKGGTSFDLEEQVHEYLRSMRYLIVLDNLLSYRALNDIEQFFSNGKNGSRIMLTTRHFDQDYRNTNVHNMTLLDPNEGWDLFCNILFFKGYAASKFEKIRNHIVEKCEGLPQSIVTVAERLSKCNNIQQEWKKIEKELESLGIFNRSSLTLSYNQLPQHLKVCFLYFGVFPKRSEILVKTLIRLWIAEGFSKFENEAYGYLKELISRSLVLIGNPSSDGTIKTCKVHSALHSFCVGEAQKEGIFCAVNTQQHPGLPLNAFANSCRWLSLYTHSFDYYVLCGTNNSRSIFFFHGNNEMLVPFKLLRVVAFVPSAFFQRVPVHLEDLIFLRYLSVTQWFEGLDYIVSTNPNLQTLVVSGNESRVRAPTLYLPSRLWESPQLRHLELGNMHTVDPPSVVKENLRTLSWVSPTHCRKEVYYNFPNIKKLKIFYKDDLEPSHTRGSCSNPIILDNLDHLKGLKKLTISVSFGCAVTLPEQSVFPSQLKKLRLSGTNLSEMDLMVIGRLPKLEVLRLENAFHGKVWKVAKGGFRELRFLLLEAKKLERWVMNNRFPLLNHLVLRFCYCLEEIPRDFANFLVFQSIELEQCRPSVVASAKHIQEDRRDLGYHKFEIKIKGPEYENHSIHI